MPLKHNYQLETDDVIASLRGARASLLLQCCCGPCSSYVLEYLTKYFDVAVLYYNPNIQPAEEYDKRLYYMRQVASKYPETVSVIECAYRGEDFMEASRGLENELEGGERCGKCFELRLRETAKLAKEGAFDYFCTTLSVSPHKDEKRLNEIGFLLEREYGVKWLPSDFKKREGYKRSNELAREYGLYRQDYCGCIFSLAETEQP
ncbi:MAG: epoxyqueuosine reductase QueH [Oscillospiraceae bacterium]|nr:epoxyqueuosine reductase QueH [Oscillospiraceae bacterium]